MSLNGRLLAKYGWLSYCQVIFIKLHFVMLHTLKFTDQCDAVIISLLDFT